MKDVKVYVGDRVKNTVDEEWNIWHHRKFHVACVGNDVFTEISYQEFFPFTKIEIPVRNEQEIIGNQYIRNLNLMATGMLFFTSRNWIWKMRTKTDTYEILRLISCLVDNSNMLILSRENI